MKRKSLIILSIVFIILNFVFVGQIYAASICTVGFSISNSTPQQSGEVVVTVSVRDITEGIASVGFTVNYDADIFETPSTENLNGWDGRAAGTTYALFAPGNEATTTSGEIYKLKFKVKSDANIGDTTIAFTNLQVAKDDGSVVDIDGVESKITIKEVQQDEQQQDEQQQDEQQQDEQQQDEQQQDEQQQDEQQQDEQQQDEQQQDEQQQDEEKQDEQQQDQEQQNENQTDKSNQKPSNTNTNDQNIKTYNTTDDNTKASKVLPKTGKTQIIISGILILAIISGISYGAYRKYSGI